MTYITDEELRNMVKYHFPEAPEESICKVELPKGMLITPATIENMCLKSTTIDDLIGMLNENKRDKTISI